MSTSVSAIVVNWNGAAILSECLASLCQQSLRLDEIIVVDNGSVDNSREVAATFDVTWLPVGFNSGLASAMNTGARAASSELLLFLNNDMRFASDFVAEMVSCLERTPGVGAIDAIQRDWEDIETVHSASTFRLAADRGLLGGWTFSPVGAESDVPTAFPSGANTLIRRSTFDALGGWDDRFFAGWEDVDLGWRLWLSGLPVILASKAVAFHRVGSSSAGPGEVIRNRAAFEAPLVFAVKHAPVGLLARTVGRALASTVASTFQRSSLPLGPRVLALSATVRSVPSLVVWRRRTYKAAGTTPRKQWLDMQAVGVKP